MSFLTQQGVFHCSFQLTHCRRCAMQRSSNSTLQHTELLTWSAQRIWQIRNATKFKRGPFYKASGQSILLTMVGWFCIGEALGIPFHHVHKHVIKYTEGSPVSYKVIYWKACRYDVETTKFWSFHVQKKITPSKIIKLKASCTGDAGII